MTKTPDDKACAWVRDRLPMLAETDADSLAPAPETEAALAPQERRAVEAHLAGCPACLARRESQTRAFDALSAAAVEPPIGPGAPSLWPALQARIQAAEARTRNPLNHAAARAASVLDELPLQLVWTEDTAREEVPERLRRWFDPQRAAVACDRLLQPAAGLAGALAAAALLAAVVGYSLAQTSRDEHEARIAAAAAPLQVTAPVQAESVPLVVTPSRAEAIGVLASSGPADLAVLDARSLAQNTLPPLREPDGRGVDVDQAARSVPAPLPTAVRFDLDRGVPMPPDARVGKPAY
ncbi:zf-HC2 domain-containing protein [Paludisphaera rhizosphaerae]|uniref:zf-HC2 domain-containing protein n=1 Tax=Paludisphaera rhizosphaerae TaxID=2711216 RepID=UPI0013EC68EE|nr:zf-HC2 domain-containing protein [Paludisphaera rhizosphaerae]